MLAIKEVAKKLVSAEGEGAETENSKKDILKLSKQLIFGSHSLEFRIGLMSRISLSINAGGSEASQFSSRLLPYLVLVMEEDILQRPLLLQLIRTLCDICNHNEAAVNELRKHPKCIKRIVNVIGEVRHMVDCRWGCYLLTIMICNSHLFMCDLIAKKYPDLKTFLMRASLFPYPWEGWPCNLAKRLRRLLGWYEKVDRMPSLPSNHRTSF